MQLPHSPVISSPLSSAPCTRTPSVYVPKFMPETKFHIHTEPWSKLQSPIKIGRLVSLFNPADLKFGATVPHKDIRADCVGT